MYTRTIGYLPGWDEAGAGSLPKSNKSAVSSAFAFSLKGSKGACAGAAAACFSLDLIISSYDKSRYICIPRL